MFTQCKFLFMRKYCMHFSFILAILTSFGCVIGTVSAHIIPHDIASLMCLSVTMPISIVSYAFISILPFMLTFLVFYIGKPNLFLLIAFCKSLFYAFVYTAVRCAFSHIGWLITALFLFVDTISFLLLFWYSLRRIGTAGSALSDAAFILSLILFSLLIYFAYITPFLTRIVYF